MLPEDDPLRRPEGISQHTTLLCRQCGGVGTFTRLTKSRLSILHLLVEGRTNKFIAKELGIGEGTLKVYMSRLFDALRVSSRAEAALWALHHGEEIGLGYRIIKANASTPAATKNGVISVELPKIVESDPPVSSADAGEGRATPDTLAS